MAKEFAKSFYKSRAWRQCRDAFFVSKHGQCERCGGAGYIVHHKRYITPQNINDPNVTLAWENLELLCQTCHNQIHHGTDVTTEGTMFDADGNLVERETHEQNV